MLKHNLQTKLSRQLTLRIVRTTEALLSHIDKLQAHCLPTQYSVSLCIHVHEVDRWYQKSKYYSSNKEHSNMEYF